MKIGLITGMVISTKKDEKLIGSKLLIIQPVDQNCKKHGDVIVGVDSVGAGVGEYVLFVSGSVASRAMRDNTAPVDTAIVGIIDKIDSYKQGRES